MSEQFLFDDFFVTEDDPGHEVDVTMKDVHGNQRVVPIYIKRGLSLSDRDAAKAKSVQTRVNSKTGQLELVGVDESVFMVELVFRTIKSWPFEREDKNGKIVPVEVTRENIKLMLAGSVDELAQRVLGLMRTQEESLDFFENKSDAAS